MPTLDTPLSYSPEGACLTIAYDTIASLTLPYVVSVEQAKRLSAMERLKEQENSTPYVLCVPFNEVIEPNAGTNERDDIQYTVMVAIVASSNADDTIDTAGWSMYIAHEITRAFNHKIASDLQGVAMPTGTALLYTTVEPGAKFIDAAARMNYDASYLVIRFHTRQVRT